METLGQYAVKPAIVGGIAAAASTYLHPNIDIKTFAGPMSLAKVTFAAVAAGSIFSDIAHEYITPHIPVLNGKLSDPVAATVAVGATSAGVAGALYTANPASLRDIGLVEIVAMSAISEISGDWLYKNYVKPLCMSSY